MRREFSLEQKGIIGYSCGEPGHEQSRPARHLSRNVSSTRRLKKWGLRAGTGLVLTVASWLVQDNLSALLGAVQTRLNPNRQSELVIQNSRLDPQAAYAEGEKGKEIVVSPHFEVFKTKFKYYDQRLDQLDIAPLPPSSEEGPAFVAAVHYQDGVDHQIQIAALDSQAQQASPLTSIEEGAPDWRGSPSLAVADNGNGLAVVVWEDARIRQGEGGGKLSEQDRIGDGRITSENQVLVHRFFSEDVQGGMMYDPSWKIWGALIRIRPGTPEVIGQPFPVSSSSTEQRYPKVIWAPGQGRFLVVWSQRSNPNRFMDWDIAAASLFPSLKGKGNYELTKEEERIVVGGSGSQTGATLFVDGKSGEIFLGHLDGPEVFPPPYRLMLAKLNAGSLTVSDRWVIAETPGVQYAFPDFEVEGENFVWVAQAWDGNNSDIVGGNNVGAKGIVFPVANSSRPEYRPGIEQLGKDWLVTWHAMEDRRRWVDLYEGVFARVLDREGRFLSEEISVAVGPGMQHESLIFKDEVLGKTFVVWEGDKGDFLNRGSRAFGAQIGGVLASQPERNQWMVYIPWIQSPRR